MPNIPASRLHFTEGVESCYIGKASSATLPRIKIGGVEMVLRPQPQKGTIPENRLRRAVMKAVAAEQAEKQGLKTNEI